MALFAKKDEAKLRIVGMHCGNCVRSVGDALRAVPGVASAQVDLAFHHAVVAYDPGRTTVDDLLKAVERAGYSATTA